MIIDILLFYNNRGIAPAEQYRGVLLRFIFIFYFFYLFIYFIYI